MTDKTPAADFSAFLLSPTGRVEINLPNGDPMMFDGKRVAVNVYSPASAEYARAKAIMERAARDKILGGKKSANEAEDNAEIDARFITAVTQSIENFPFPGGAEAIYRERALMYIEAQVRQYLNDQANFFGKSKAS